MRLPLLAAFVAAAVLGCKPTTPRPYFPPVTGAPAGEIELDVVPATEAIADVLRSDSFPLRRVEPRDGYLETHWFDARTKAPVSGRILGPDVVQIRAWVNPAKRHSSRVTIETTYRPLADPSLPPRELDHQVPPDHPVGKRVIEIVTELARLYAGTADPVPTVRRDTTSQDEE
jgi:hypothetical protein